MQEKRKPKELNLHRRDWEELPKIIQEVGLDFHWDNRKVWELEIPAEPMDLPELEWQFDIPF